MNARSSMFAAVAALLLSSVAIGSAIGPATATTVPVVAFAAGPVHA